MGKEVLDMCTDEESDCVLISSASDNPERSDDHASEPYLLSGMEETIMGNSDSRVDPVTLGSEEDGAKEDIMTYPVELSIHGLDNCFKEQELPCVDNLNLDAETEEKKRVNRLVQKPTNSKNLDHPVKLASKSTAGYVKSSHTVPQPFALATDKRASGGNRALLPNVAGDGNKNSNSDSLQSQNLVKKAQVISFSPLFSFLFSLYSYLFNSLMPHAPVLGYSPGVTQSTVEFSF